MRSYWNNLNNKIITNEEIQVTQMYKYAMYVYSKHNTKSSITHKNEFSIAGDQLCPWVQGENQEVNIISRAWFYLLLLLAFASCSSSSDISLPSTRSGNEDISGSGLLGATGEEPGGTNSPKELAGVSSEDLGESDEVALGLFNGRKGNFNQDEILGLHSSIQLWEIKLNY